MATQAYKVVNTHARLVPDFGGQLMDTDPDLADIDTFTVPLSTYVLIEIHIKGITITISDKYVVL